MQVSVCVEIDIIKQLHLMMQLNPKLLPRTAKDATTFTNELKFPNKYFIIC